MRNTPSRPSPLTCHGIPLLIALATALGISIAPPQQAGGAEPRAALTISSDHADGYYAVGEPIRWRLEGDALSNLVETTYTLKQGGLKVIAERSITLDKGAKDIEATMTEPGTLLLEVKAKDQEGKVTRVLGGAAISPDRIRPSAPRPADFDDFWKAKLEELYRIPANPQLTSADSVREGVDYWKISMDNIRETHIRGQLARPKQGTKLPAMLIVQWAGVYPLQKAWATDPAASGWLVLNINAHDLPIDEDADFYKKQSEGPLKNYWAIGNDDRETSYFLRMYLSCYRGAEYLTGRADWDGKTLLVTGNSQGGLQALMTAGFHPKVTAAIAGVPAGCDFTGPDVGRSSGWPGWYWSAEGKDPAKVREASRYYDVVNFASRINCPVLAGVGLIDETCPPEGIFAALNQAKAPKEILLLTRGDHMGSHNSHEKFYQRSAIWRTALHDGKPAPVESPGTR